MLKYNQTDIQTCALSPTYNAPVGPNCCEDKATMQLTSGRTNTPANILQSLEPNSI